MAELKIRNLDANTIQNLKELARIHSISREEYVRRILKQHVTGAEIKSVQREAEFFMDELEQVIKYTASVLEENNEILNLTVTTLEKNDKRLEKIEVVQDQVAESIKVLNHKTGIKHYFN